MKFLKGFLLIIFCLFFAAAQAQLPSDLSNVTSEQITDAQLKQIIGQAKSSGVSVENLENEMLRRGLPPEELSLLKKRIAELEETETEEDTEEKPQEKPKTTKRTAPQKREQNWEEEGFFEKKSRLFGSELFTSSNLSFEPDMRMATPKNYVVGPDDELILNIYGLNMSQQTLKVSPDGTVNVKYAGVVYVSGMTVEAATATIRSRLLRFYPGLSSGATKLNIALGNIRSIRIIMIGAVTRPGTYTLPSLASMFNALYVSGGPAENGSLRNIELIRGNKVIQTADLYDFLVRGDLSGNVRLEDNDVIRIPFAETLITINGLVNRPGIFEMKKSESLMDALQFAGGFRSNAFRGRITGTRIADLEREVIDVANDSLRVFRTFNGDEYYVDSVINRYLNRVIIRGAVFKPGAYALENGMTLKNLIEKAQGLKEDVYTGRAVVVRTRPDLTKQYLDVELRPIMYGQDAGILLQREDSVQITSIFDLRDSTTVTINGAVRRPGTFRYEDSLSLKSLILKAEGYAENATGAGIEISRRKRNADVIKKGSSIVELIRIDDTKELSKNSPDVILQPYDIVTIKEDPFYKKQISVRVSGEVLMPAVYTLQSREERLSSLINRSGGLLYTANVAGAKLIRQKKEVVDTSEIKRLFKSVGKDSTVDDTDIVNKKTTDVAINLGYILKHPGSTDDITLEEGDELIIPRINNTVSVGGEVFKPLDIMYERSKSLKDYLDDAGGVTTQGVKKRTFVIYPNGSSAKRKMILGLFAKYPKVEPGSQVFVPQKERRSGLDIAKAGIFISAVTALITALSLVRNN
jgi:protein involved in polysaccharide export with SLBB domain